MASTLPVDRPRLVRSKPAFANRVRRFVKPAAARLLGLPGFPILWVASAAAAMLMIVTGGFGTGQLPLGMRSLFWMLLLGWGCAKWQIWFVLTVRKPADWMRASLVGSFLLNLPLPVEIGLCLRLLGVAGGPGPWETWLRALALGAAVLAPIYAITHRPRPIAAPAGAAPSPDRLLARCRIVAEDLIAVAAEDHYCRVHRRDGSSILLHYRFADALAEVTALDGAQVHRGIWVAAMAVRGAVRDGRRWRLRLADGRLVPVSASHLGAVRSRGWLRRNSSTTCAAEPQSAVALTGCTS